MTRHFDQQAPAVKVVVLLCTALNEVGGTSRHMAQIYRGLDRSRVRPVIVFSSLQEDALRVFFIKEGCAAEDIRVIPHVTRCFCGAFMGLRRAWHELKPDIVHSFFLHSDILAWAATLGRSSVVRISSVEGKFLWDRVNGVGGFKQACYRFLNWMIRKSFFRTVAVSMELGQEVVAAGADPRKVLVIPLGIACCDARALRPRPEEGDVVVGCLSRFVPDKGMDLLFEAAAAALPATPRLSFLLASSDNDVQSLKALAAKSGVRDGAVFCGWVSDLTDFFNRIDIFVMPSRREGCPIALIEAMVHQKPAVVFDVAGVREIALNEKNALVVPAFDTVAFAQAIGRLASDSGLRTALGARARVDAMARYSIGREIQQLEAVYEQAGKV